MLMRKKDQKQIHIHFATAINMHSWSCPRVTLILLLSVAIQSKDSDYLGIPQNIALVAYINDILLNYFEPWEDAVGIILEASKC